ncbi:AfsR/SARP family transcriptional regulator [Allonocardiopsis opalescens]|nr:tetratricopeptide repeat protein [Allonocardiopsis opalescens]
MVDLIPDAERWRPDTWWRYVSELRSRLTESSNGAVRIVAQSGTYQLVCGNEVVDLQRFHWLCDEARRKENRQDYQAAMDLRGQAVALWRGVPLSGLSDRLRVTGLIRSLLNEYRTAVTAWAEAAVQAGQARTMLEQSARCAVRYPAEEFPADERTVEVLMKAHSQAGNPAVALRLYQELAGRLHREQGNVPGPRLRELHAQILHDTAPQATDPGREAEHPATDHALATVVGGPEERNIPRQLPPAVTDFVGRSRELDLLTRRLDDAGGHGGAVVITSIGGIAGVGKTALALWWAHRIGHRFPDGHLYVDLRGYGPDDPMHPTAVLTQFLDALGVSAQDMPMDEQSKIGLYRSLLAGRKMLVMLDNAKAAEQIRPLLPGSPGCLVVVTSRSDLPSLVAGNGARPITLTCLSQTEAINLLRLIIGPSRVDRELDLAATLVCLCSCLPLALRIVAQRTAFRPELSLAQIVDELTAEQDRLDGLATPDGDPTTDVRLAFSWSYQALSAEAARLFRLLGLHSGPDISVTAGAALGGISPSRAHRLMEHLASAHLLERSGTDRYHFHDLLRSFARECADAEETSDDRETAVRHLVEWYLHTAHATCNLLIPIIPTVDLDAPSQPCPAMRFETPSRAMEWCETERANLVAAVQQAATQGEHRIAWQLPAALTGYFNVRKPWDDWIATCRTGLASAEHVNDEHGRSWLLTNLGIAYCGLGRYREAQEHLEGAFRLCRTTGNRWGESIVLNVLGDTFRDRDLLEAAVDCYERARDICNTIEEPWGKVGAALAVHNLAHTYQRLGRYEDALARHQQTLQLADDLNDFSWGRAQSVHHLADTHRAAGQLADAIDCYAQALIVRRRNGDRHGEAATLSCLGTAQLEAGDPQAARDSWGEALIIFTELQDPRRDGVRAKLDALDTGQP